MLHRVRTQGRYRRKRRQRKNPISFSSGRKRNYGEIASNRPTSQEFYCQNVLRPSSVRHHTISQGTDDPTQRRTLLKDRQHRARRAELSIPLIARRENSGRMSAFGTKRTSQPTQSMSALGGKADIQLTRSRLEPVPRSRLIAGGASADFLEARPPVGWSGARLRIGAPSAALRHEFQAERISSAFWRGCAHPIRKASGARLPSIMAAP